MRKEIKSYITNFGLFRPFFNRQKKQSNILNKESINTETINNIVIGIIGNWRSNPMSLYSIAPVNKAINAYLTPIDEMDVLLKKKIQNKPDTILNKDSEDFKQYMEYRGGYYFNNKIIDIKDILKKLVIVNALYYQYFILYTKEGFFDIILNNFIKSENGSTLTITYNNYNYLFNFDSTTGEYKAIIKNLYQNQISENSEYIEYIIYEYCDELLDSDYINVHKTPLYPVLTHLAIYLKALYTNLYKMTEMQKPKGILKFDNNISTEQMKLHMQNMNNIMSEGGILTAAEGVEYQDINKIIDADYQNAQIKAEDSVFHLFGIPIVLIRTESSTYDNFKTSYSIFIEQDVHSKLKKNLKILNKILINKIHETTDIFIAVDHNDLFIIKERKKDIAVDLKNAGIISINEARQDCGRITDDGKVSTIKGGEDILVHNNLVKITNAGNLKGLDSEDNGELVSG